MFVKGVWSIPEWCQWSEMFDGGSDCTGIVRELSECSVLFAVTGRALEAFWPAPLEELIAACTFVTIEFKELNQAYAFLELNHVLSHDRTPTT